MTTLLSQFRQLKERENENSRFKPLLRREYWDIVSPNLLFYPDVSFFSPLLTDIPLHFPNRGIHSSTPRPPLSDDGATHLNTGLLVVDSHRRMVSLNQKFIKLWGLTKPLILSRNDGQALEFVSNQFKNPEKFIREVRELYDLPALVIHDAINLKDGRIFERYSQPQFWQEKIVGRLWKFRELV